MFGEGMRKVVVANVHIISGTESNPKRTAVVPGTSPEARERFKMTAALNVLLQCQAEIQADLALATSQGRAGPVAFVCGDFNLRPPSMKTALSGAVSYTGATFVGPLTKTTGGPRRSARSFLWGSPELPA